MYLKSFVLTVLIALVGADNLENCFINNHLQFVYDVPEFSGTYLNVKEYWMQKGARCYLMVATDTKMAWQNDDIVVKIDLFYDNERLGNGKGCRNHKNNIKTYEKGRPITIGKDDTEEGQESEESTGKENHVCMVKYIIQNKNASKDYRIQLYQADAPDEDGASFVKFPMSLLSAGIILMMLY